MYKRQPPGLAAHRRHAERLRLRGLGGARAEMSEKVHRALGRLLLPVEEDGLVLAERDGWAAEAVSTDAERELGNHHFSI